MTEENKKDPKSSDEHINLKVLGQDNNVVQFKIKKGTPLRKLMNAYCERCNLSMSTVRFRFDGQPINEQDTPSSLEMEEGDTIEIYQQQTGGFKSSTAYTETLSNPVNFKRCWGYLTNESYFICCCNNFFKVFHSANIKTESYHQTGKLHH